MSLRLLRRTLAAGPGVSPFLVLGDPSPDLSVELARIAVGEGAGMLELGFPYRDPVADGPAIQAAANRALAAGVSTRSALRVLARIRDACPETPLNLLVYGNLVHRPGYDRFCSEAVAAGASSLLVPDIPLDEAAPLRRASSRAGLGHVEMAGPRADRSRLRKLDRASAMLYLAGFQGVTGVRDAGFEPVLERVREVGGMVSAPLCLGFGISNRSQVRDAFAAGARVAVVGSFLARVIGRHADRLETLPGAFAAAVRSLMPHNSG